MSRYMSINSYTFTDLRSHGASIVDIVDALFQLSSKYRPVKFRADLVGRKRNRYFKASEKNLQMLREELLSGKVRQLHLNDNSESEGMDPRASIDASLYHLDFWLDFTRPHEKLAPALPSSPNKCQFLFDMEAFYEPEVFVRLMSLARRVFSEFATSWADIYFCTSEQVCFLHFLGSSHVQHRRDASEDFETIIIDRGRFYDSLCDVLARDAYFGVFLNPSHLRNIGGLDRLRAELSFEVVEQLPNGGAFLMASSDPFDFDKPEIRERIERLREILLPVSMFQFGDSRVAKDFADRLRSSRYGNCPE